MTQKIFSVRPVCTDMVTDARKKNGGCQRARDCTNVVRSGMPASCSPRGATRTRDG